MSNMVATLSGKVIYGIIDSKTCQLLSEIVLYILNTPGKLLEKAQKGIENPGFLNHESVRTLDYSTVYMSWFYEPW